MLPSMRPFSPPYQFFLWAAVLLLGASFIRPGLRADIHLHDTFFVFNLGQLLRALAFGTFLLWLLYLVNKPYLHSAKMIRIHVVVTLVSLAALLGITLWISTMRDDLLPTRQDAWTVYYRARQVQMITLTLLAGAQVVFLMNLLMGVKRAFRKK